MENTFREIAAGVLCLLLLTSLSMAVEPNDVGTDMPTAKAAVIVCKGDIDDGLYQSIRRRTEFALDDGVEYLIYEIGTYGGLVKSADDIAKYFILDVGKKAHTVAYVTTEAISAGALISVSCQDIVMLENTTIGDCAPIMLGGKLEGVEREKMESFTRAAFARAAQENGYPPALLKAMVSIKTEVYRIKNLKTDQYEFFESEQLPKDANVYDLSNKELIVKDDELLTLTAAEAYEYGIARAVVKNLNGVLDFLSKRDGVIFPAEPMMLETNWSEELVRWLNSPGVMAVLVMLALLGVYIEFSTPGLGLPGLVAAICFATIIGSKYLVGLANWMEVAVFILGILLLLVEFLILPGFGIAGILGIIFILGGLFGMLIRNPPNRFPWPHTALDWRVFTNGVLGLSLGFLGFIVFAWLFAKYLPKIRFLSGLILMPTIIRGDEMRVSMTTEQRSELKKINVGDTGEVVSKLRPTGKAKFGDSIVDVVAEADFLDKGSKVEIIEIHGNKVIVKKQIEDG